MVKELTAPRAVAYPLQFDTVCGGMDEETGWIIDAEGRYLAEAVAEDSEGKYVKSARKRNEILANIVSRANGYCDLIVALKALVMLPLDTGNVETAIKAIAQAESQ